MYTYNLLEDQIFENHYFMANNLTILFKMAIIQLCFSGPGQKKHIISPLLKKTTLDKNELMNYRPVSNLSFISKILEKVVASRLLSHMEANSMSNNLQSAYKKFHSTESALLKVENDVNSIWRRAE